MIHTHNIDVWGLVTYTVSFPFVLEPGAVISSTDGMLLIIKNVSLNIITGELDCQANCDSKLLYDIYTGAICDKRVVLHLPD